MCLFVCLFVEFVVVVVFFFLGLLYCFSFWLHLLMAFDITRYPDYKETFKGP